MKHRFFIAGILKITPLPDWFRLEAPPAGQVGRVDARTIGGTIPDKGKSPV
jgi:hypothetical protein